MRTVKSTKRKREKCRTFIFDWSSYVNFGVYEWGGEKSSKRTLGFECSIFLSVGHFIGKYFFFRPAKWQTTNIEWQRKNEPDGNNNNNNSTKKCIILTPANDYLFHNFRIFLFYEPFSILRIKTDIYSPICIGLGQLKWNLQHQQQQNQREKRTKWEKKNTALYRGKKSHSRDCVRCFR